MRSLIAKAASFFLGAGFVVAEAFESTVDSIKEDDYLSDYVSVFCSGLAEDTCGSLVPMTDANLGYYNFAIGIFLIGGTTSL